jgi:hypothetical protein
VAHTGLGNSVACVAHRRLGIQLMAHTGLENSVACVADRGLGEIGGHTQDWGFSLWHTQDWGIRWLGIRWLAVAHSGLGGSVACVAHRGLGNSVAWDSVAWDSVAWDSVAWDSVAWDSVACVAHTGLGDLVVCVTHRGLGDSVACVACEIGGFSVLCGTQDFWIRWLVWHTQDLGFSVLCDFWIRKLRILVSVFYFYFSVC